MKTKLTEIENFCVSRLIKLHNVDTHNFHLYLNCLAINNDIFDELINKADKEKQQEFGRISTWVGPTSPLSIEELGKKGYEYNRGIHTLLTIDMAIPSEFIFYCLLVEDSQN